MHTVARAFFLFLLLVPPASLAEHQNGAPFYAYAGKNQPIVQGSYAFVSPHVYLEQLDGLRIELCVFPTRQDGTRTLVSSWGDEGGFAIELCDGVRAFVSAWRRPAWPSWVRSTRSHSGAGLASRRASTARVAAFA